MDIPSPFDGGGRGHAAQAPALRVGVDKMKTYGPPSPSSPPTGGRGEFVGLCLFNYGLLSNKNGVFLQAKKISEKRQEDVPEILNRFSKRFPPERI
jgi:hypothetical protein